MIVNSGNISQLGKTFKAISMAQLESQTPKWQLIAMLVTSTTSQNDYGWLNDIPGMREWIGERQVQNLSDSGYSIRNRDFELTVSVGRNNIEDDNIGLYTPMFQQLGYAVAYSPDEIIFDLLRRAFTERCYDGRPFFAANHPVGRRSVSNVSDKTLTRLEFQGAMAQMQSLTNEAGRPLRVFMNRPKLLVGPSSRAAALTIVGVPTLPNGGANPDYQAAEIEIIPEFVGDAANFWVLADVSQPIKPLILQRRKEPEFVRKDDARDDNVFNQKEFVYGYDDRKAAGFGFWQLAFGSTGAVAGAV